jgi:hypothetical protein
MSVLQPDIARSEEAEMRIIGVDLHTRQQSIAMLDDQTGELVEKELQHEGERVREFYSGMSPGFPPDGFAELRVLNCLQSPCAIPWPIPISGNHPWSPALQTFQRREVQALLTPSSY